MKRKFYIEQGRYHADLMAIQIQDFDYETDCYFIIECEGKSPIRIDKRKALRSYYDSWGDAWEELKRRAKQNIIDKQNAVVRAQKDYDAICGMTEPNYRPVGFR